MVTIRTESALGVFCITQLLLACAIPSARAQNNLVSNPGFESVKDGKAVSWGSYEKGYEIDESVHHGGSRSIKCVNASAAERRGATFRVDLNQKDPAPLLFTAWSRAADVGGTSNTDYSLYLDLQYTDGTPFFGQIAPFATGTHDWQRRSILITAPKPLRQATIYLLLRSHSGTAWFDDVSVEEVEPSRFFDSQSIQPPKLPRGEQSGWFARDVAAGSPILPLSPSAPNSSLGLKIETRAGGPADVNEVLVSDTTGKQRAVTVYYVERFSSRRAVWWNDIRQSIPADDGVERSNTTRISVGASGGVSLYPLGCVTSGNRGRALGVPPELGPRVSRIGYHSGDGLFYCAFDVALTSENEANRDSGGHGTAKVAVAAYDVDPAWGFRSAVEHFYKLFPAAFERRAKAEGIWIPFTDPSTVQGYQDFGFAYHEGSNSVASDDKLGVISLRYTEPMTWWMPMPPSTPRTYEAAMEMVTKYASGTDETKKREAQSVLNSGSRDENGHYNVDFMITPWSNGAVWVLNPNPRISHAPEQWTKGRTAFGKDIVEKAYGTTSNGVLDGDYLDSIENWAETPDFRPESIKHLSVPPTFSSDSFKPIALTWFSVWELASEMHRELLHRDKLLMANSTPWRIHDFAPLLDIMGTETNWNPGGTWRPDSDAVFNLRRTLCYHKPYLLLQNTNFEQFGSDKVEKYFQRSMFYGVFPSMFSPDAANHRYWETPALYNRDRTLFQKYIPVIQKLSADGWEPVTYVTSDNPAIYVERFGTRQFTVLNSANANADVRLTVDLAKLGIPSSEGIRVVDSVTQKTVATLSGRDKPSVNLSLRPEEGLALRLEGGQQVRGRGASDLLKSAVDAIEKVRKAIDRPDKGQ